MSRRRRLEIGMGDRSRLLQNPISKNLKTETQNP